MYGNQNHLFPRPKYTSLLEKLSDSSSIKVLMGIRRCGKSSLLKMFMSDLAEQGVPDTNLFYKKMDSFDVPLEPNAAWLDELLQKAINEANPSHPLFAFLNEIQEINGWEKPIRRLYESGRAQIFITGSNANLLSSDLATYLSGRYVEMQIYPLSFKEYLDFRAKRGQNSPDSIESEFVSYLRFGGMPGLFEFDAPSEEIVTKELTAIHDTVLLNDVAKRFGIRDIDLLEKLLRYVYTTSGNLFSANKVSGTLTSMGRKTNPETIDNYLNALKKAFALYECPQIALKGKSILSPRRKYYAPDNGLRNLESGFNMQDIGFQLENIVYIELLRRGYQVSVGKLPSAEIDFIAKKQSERIYIQVCESLISDEVRKREIGALETIKDSHPKIVLTRDASITGITDSGIRIELVSTWLLN